ncbi:type II CAAX prenyl endopeptidase Rce1 family protein [Bacillota bacterium Meth-B3]
MQGDYPINGEFRDWARRPMLSAVAIMYFFAAAGLVLIQALGALARHLSPAWGGAAASALSALFQLGFLLWPVARYAVQNPGSALGMRLKRPPLWGVLIALLAAVVGVMLAGNLGTLWLLLIEALGGRLSGGAPPPATPWHLAARLLTGALLPGLCEEWMFRGAMLSAWERRGTRAALFISTVLFASLHASFEGLPIQLVIGLALGVLTLATDSVVTAMIHHAFYNALLLLMSPGAQATGERLYDALGGVREVWLTAMRAGTLGAIYAGLLLVAWHLGGARGRPAKVARAPESMEPWALVILAAGVVTALCLYLINLLMIAGVMR